MRLMSATAHAVAQNRTAKRFYEMDSSELMHLRKLRSSEATESAETPDKPQKMGEALRRKITSLTDLCLEFPEENWVILLRMHYRPVHALRISRYGTETVRTHGGVGDEVWMVGQEKMTKDEAIYLAEKLRTSQKPPLWGTLDLRFGSSFLH